MRLGHNSPADRTDSTPVVNRNSKTCREAYTPPKIKKDLQYHQFCYELFPVNVRDPG